METQTAIAIPSWGWAVPLLAAFIGALIAFGGVLISAFFQQKNFKRQISSAHTLKLAEMEKERINYLRDAMCEFQSYGITPNLDHALERKFYENGTRIELLMKLGDPYYEELSQRLYSFLRAESIDEKYRQNALYVETCRHILNRDLVNLQENINGANN